MPVVGGDGFARKHIPCDVGEDLIKRALGLYIFPYIEQYVGCLLLNLFFQYLGAMGVIVLVPLVFREVPD